MGLPITRKMRQGTGLLESCVEVGRPSFREQEMNGKGLHERSPSIGWAPFMRVRDQRVDSGLSLRSTSKLGGGPIGSKFFRSGTSSLRTHMTS